MASPTLPKIERGTTATAACIDSLRERIVSGAFAPGTKLPGERELCAQLGVSRVTVRAALAHLAAERLVDVQATKGAVVSDFKETAGPELLGPWIELARGDAADDAVRDLLAIRRALAGVVLARVKRSALPRIAAAVDAFAAVVASGADTAAIARADLAVTRAILRETKSPVLQLCMNPIAAVLEGLPELRAAMYAKPHENVLAYRAFLAAVDAGADAAALAGDALAERDEATLRKWKRRRKR